MVFGLFFSILIISRLAILITENLTFVIDHIVFTSKPIAFKSFHHFTPITLMHL